MSETAFELLFGDCKVRFPEHSSQNKFVTWFCIDHNKYYQGQVNKMGRPSGKGIYVDAHDHVHLGMFKDGVRDGPGCEIRPDGTSIYEITNRGWFFDSVRIGFGPDGLTRLTDKEMEPPRNYKLCIIIVCYNLL